MPPHQIKSVQCLSSSGLHSMAYKQWGDPRNPNVLVCVHGVTRVGDDFDVLARALVDTYRVVCPDVVGRGRSGRLLAAQDYQLPQYVSDMVTLLARIDAETIDWFGTSMGGLIGMGIAAMPGNPIRKLILNDIGPVLDPVALARIGQYIGTPVSFATFDEGAAYIRAIASTFGPHTDGEWKKMAADVLSQNEQGKWVRDYDLALAEPFRQATPESMRHAETLLWQAYDAIQCPTLLVRGELSDLLSHDVAQSMTQRGPCATLVEIAGVGHAPTFLHADQIAVAKNFLLG